MANWIPNGLGLCLHWFHDAALDKASQGEWGKKVIIMLWFISVLNALSSHWNETMMFCMAVIPCISVDHVQWFICVWNFEIQLTPCYHYCPINKFRNKMVLCLMHKTHNEIFSITVITNVTRYFIWYKVWWRGIKRHLSCPILFCAYNNEMHKQNTNSNAHLEWYFKLVVNI